MISKLRISNGVSLSLQWQGKDDCLQVADQPSRFTRFVESQDLSIGSNRSNILIEADNLDALKLLQRDYAGKVDLIYIDPPYNTGNSFVYHDSYEQASWLNMMYPRLVLAHRLLSADGAIFISIDDNEIDKLRLIMSEIFSEQNFIAQITIKSNPRGRQAERHFATVHEYLLVYARDAMLCKFAGSHLTEEQSAEFDCQDEEGRRYRLLGLRQRGAHSLKEDRPAMHFPIYVDPTGGGISLEPDARHTCAVLPKKSTGQAGRWMWGRERVTTHMHLLEARLIRGRQQWDIFVRDYFEDKQGNARRRKVKTIWDDKQLNYQNGKRELKELLGRSPLDYPKPVALPGRLIELIDKPAGIYMDFFAGSGTLGQAVIEANTADGGSRRFILVQIAEPTEDVEFPTIVSVCHARLKTLLRRLTRQQQKLSGGLRYWKLV